MCVLEGFLRPFFVWLHHLLVCFFEEEEEREKKHGRGEISFLASLKSLSFFVWSHTRFFLCFVSWLYIFSNLFLVFIICYVGVTWTGSDSFPRKLQIFLTYFNLCNQLWAGFVSFVMKSAVCRRKMVDCVSFVQVVNLVDDYNSNSIAGWLNLGFDCPQDWLGLIFYARLRHGGHRYFKICP